MATELAFYIMETILLLLPPLLLLGAMALGRPTLPDSTLRLRILAIVLPLLIVSVNLIGSYQLSRMQGELALVSNPGMLLIGVVTWTLFILAIAPLFEQRRIESDAASADPYNIPTAAWAALAVSWAIATLAVFLVYPGLGMLQLLVLLFAMGVLGAGPWMTRHSNPRTKVISGRQKAVLAWSCFATIGVLIFGKTALIAILSHASGAYTAQSISAAADYMDVLLVGTAAAYALVFLGYWFFVRRYKKGLS